MRLNGKGFKTVHELNHYLHDQGEAIDPFKFSILRDTVIVIEIPKQLKDQKWQIHKDNRDVILERLKQSFNPQKHHNLFYSKM